jgi:hypothetical protein
MTQSNASGIWIELLDTIQKEQSINDGLVLMRGPGRSDENLGVLRAFRELSAGPQGGLDRYRARAPHIHQFSTNTGSQRQTRSSQTGPPTQDDTTVRRTCLQTRTT